MGPDDRHRERHLLYGRAQRVGVGRSVLVGWRAGGRLPGQPDRPEGVDKPFSGTWWGHHPVLRDATGNNDFSDKGTTPFRFQLAPVAAPAAGDPDAVMDANPFTYQVMADEVARWYGDTSTNANSPEPGQAEQYLSSTSTRRARCLVCGRRPTAFRHFGGTGAISAGVTRSFDRPCPHRRQAPADWAASASPLCPWRLNPFGGRRVRPSARCTSSSSQERPSSGSPLRPPPSCLKP